LGLNSANSKRISKSKHYVLVKEEKLLPTTAVSKLLLSQLIKLGVHSLSKLPSRSRFGEARPAARRHSQALNTIDLILYKFWHYGLYFLNPWK
jgi:hypothetical protein